MQVIASQRPSTQRMFFALWPGVSLQRELARIAKSMQVAFGGRTVDARNIHLTLAFLGSVPSARVDELLAIGASIRTARFILNLVETGCWKRSAVAWIAPDASPQPLEDLVIQLRQRLIESRFDTDDKPFVPHVTLLRKAKCRTQPVKQETLLEWRIEDFVLIRSDTLSDGARYSRIGGWPLRA